MSFDLLTESWIPVIRTDGSSDTLSIRAVFGEAAQIRRVAAELPTQSFAIMRLLLAICHDAIGFRHEDDVEEGLTRGLDVAQIEGYLDRFADRFDLFHPARPFMQVADLRTAKDEAAGLEKLISDVPNGTPFLTIRGGEALRRISAAEAAVWLIHAQAYDPSGIRSAAVGDPETSGGKGYPIGPSWVGQIGGVLLHGDSLAETLPLNLVPTQGAPGDRPFWASDIPQTALRQLEPKPHGPVELLVWQSRRIRLVGNRDAVTGVVLSQGDRMTPQNRHAVEFMTAWRYSKPQTKKLGMAVYMPQKHDPERAGWRGLPALLSTPEYEDGHATSIPPATVAQVARLSDEVADLDRRIGVELIGMDYGPQEATVNDIVADTLDLRASVLGREAGQVRVLIHDAVATADACVWALGRMAANLASAAGDFDGVDGARSRATLAGWSALDDPARAWLATLGSETDTIEAKRAWHQEVRAAMEGQLAVLAATCSPAAVAGRQTKFGFMTAAQAEIYFRSALRKELPLAYPQTTQEGGDRG